MYFSQIRNGNPNVKKQSPIIIDKDVVIIGGGCAGVECASKLYSYGFKNIELLEGKNIYNFTIKTFVFSQA